MQDIESDMDDLFRKAVDSYSLQSGESNWNAIVAQLSDIAVSSAEINHKKNTVVNGKTLLFFLLIPLSTAMLSYYSNGNIATTNNAIIHSYKPVLQKANNIKTTDDKELIANNSAGKIKNIKPVEAPLVNAGIKRNLSVKKAPAFITIVENKYNKPDDSYYSKVNEHMSSTPSINDSIDSPEVEKTLADTPQKSTENKLQPITPPINASKKIACMQASLQASLLTK